MGEMAFKNQQQWSNGHLFAKVSKPAIKSSIVIHPLGDVPYRVPGEPCLLSMSIASFSTKNSEGVKAFPRSSANG